MTDISNNSGIPLKRVLEALYCDEELSDVKFEGMDGGIVPAHSNILAARSPVFRALLFGNFSEAKRKGTVRLGYSVFQSLPFGNFSEVKSEDTIALGYSSKVLKSVVQFCHTDEAEILQVAPLHASSVMELADAANYFDLLELKDKAEEAVTAEIKRRPESACLFLQEAVNMSHGSIEEFARKAIRAKPKEALLEAGSVIHLSSSILESILDDEEIRVTESTLFQILIAWAGKSDACAARQAEAKNLTKCLRLERIPSSHLTSLVEPSGLVSQDQLMRAYKVQATQAEDKYAVRSDRMQFGGFPYNWLGFESSIAESTGERKTTLLQPNFIIHTGIWTWSLQVEELCHFTSVGVASSSYNIDEEKDLGEQEGGWAYVSDYGYAFTNQEYREGFPRCRAGSLISFTLDLTGHGTLHASVNRGDAFILFYDMLDAFDEDRQEVGFLPAVSLKSPGRVRFLGLEKVENL